MLWGCSRGIPPCSRPPVLPIFLLIVWPLVVLAQATNTTYNDLANITGGQFTGQWTVIRPNNQENATVYSSETLQDAFVMFFRGSAIYILGSYEIDRGLPHVFINGSLIDYVNTTSASPTPNQSAVWSTELHVEGDHQLMIRNTPTGAAEPAKITMSSIIVTSNGDPRPRTSGFTATTIPSEALIVDDMDSRIAYSGNWSSWWWEGGGGQEIYKGTRHQSRAPDSNSTFTFNGTAIWYYGLVGPGIGVASVSVDDETPKIVSMADQVWMGQQLIYSRINLTDREHTLKIQNTGNNGDIFVDFLRYLPSQSRQGEGTSVSGRSRKPPLHLIIPLTVLGVVLVIAAIVLYCKLRKGSNSRSQASANSFNTAPARVVAPPLKSLVAPVKVEYS